MKEGGQLYGTIVTKRIQTGPAFRRRLRLAATGIGRYPAKPWRPGRSCGYKSA
jgi:hypothetical protein